MRRRRRRPSKRPWCFLRIAAVARPARAADPPTKNGRPMLSFQQLILRLQSYWGERGCALLQPYDMEVGAGTSHT